MAEFNGRAGDSRCGRPQLHDELGRPEFARLLLLSSGGGDRDDPPIVVKRIYGDRHY